VALGGSVESITKLVFNQEIGVVSKAGSFVIPIGGILLFVLRGVGFAKREFERSVRDSVSE